MAKISGTESTYSEPISGADVGREVYERWKRPSSFSAVKLRLGRFGLRTFDVQRHVERLLSLPRRKHNGLQKSLWVSCQSKKLIAQASD